MFKFLSKQKDRIVYYKACFGTEEGKRVLWDLCKTHGILNSSFNKDALEMARAEGERNVILRILHILDTDISALEGMISDGKEYDKNYTEE